MKRFRTKVVAPFLQTNGKPTQINTGGEGYAEVTLTSAQVKALKAAPQELVSAPGAGRYLELVSARLILNYGGSNAFVDTSDETAIKYKDGAGVQASQDIESVGFIDATVDTVSNALPKIDQIGAVTAVENQPLVLHKIGGNEFAGNAANDNTLTVQVKYRVHNI